MPISVIICCYNGERYLRETLESLLAQTLPPLEIIVIDDGSTDGSAALAESFGDPVRIIRQANQGLPASRNVGIQAARGDYLFLIDADDLIHASSLERLYAAAQGKPNAVAIMGFSTFRDDFQQPFATRTFDFDDFFPEIIGGNFGPQHNRLVPRHLALRAGCFDPTMYLFEDWLFWCRVALAGGHLAPIPFVGAYYRRHDSTMSYTAPKLAAIEGHVRVMEALSTAMLQRPDLLAAHGERLFWGCWTALHAARQHGVTRSKLRNVESNLRQISNQGPNALRRSRLARLIQWTGTRFALNLRHFIVSATDEV